MFGGPVVKGKCLAVSRCLERIPKDRLAHSEESYQSPPHLEVHSQLVIGLEVELRPGLSEWDTRAFSAGLQNFGEFP